MTRQEKWDRRFLSMAQLIASWSKDPSTQVGAVVVNSLGQIVGQGYNGFPRGVKDRQDRYYDRNTKYTLTVHAELNAILHAGHLARGATLYVWPSFPEPFLCNECAKSAIQSGIRSVVGFKLQDPRSVSRGRWAESIGTAKFMLHEAGLSVRSYNEFG